MTRYLQILLALAVFSGTAVAQQTRTVTAGNNQELFDVLNEANNDPQTDYEIIVLPDPDSGSLEYVFDQPFNEMSASALPLIVGRVSLMGPSAEQTVIFRRDFEAMTDFRFAEVSFGELQVEFCTFLGFRSMGDGGVIRSFGGRLIVLDSIFQGNFAAGSGGAIYSSLGTSTAIARSRLQFNQAVTAGGAVFVSGEQSMTGFGTLIGLSTFTGNRTDGMGSDIQLLGEGNVHLTQNAFSSDSIRQSVNVMNEDALMSANTWSGIYDPFEVEGNLVYHGNIFHQQQANRDLTLKTLCNVIGNGSLTSLGFNLDSTDSCSLDQPTDLVNTDPLTGFTDINGVIPLLSGSPAIDSGPSDFINGLLPCGYRDIRGLGSPQDANGDGIFECDIGSYEVQGGDDIAGPQTAAYFDPARSGEGAFVEMLPGGQAFVAEFSYSPDGTELVWFVGIGEVVGNSIVIDDVLQPVGGIFGAAFDPSAITRRSVGSMSLVFPGCESVSSPGRQIFQANESGGFEDILVTASRLSTVLPCNGMVPATSGRSGSFFDASRSGEGVFVQWLSNGSVLIIWYTFDPEGNQFWTISSDVTIDGNTVTANMLYPTSLTRFGSAFDPSEVGLSPWGTVTLVYQPGCDSIAFSYASTVSGFGAGNYDYSRLTSIDGAACDL